MLTRRLFLRDSAIVLAGAGTAPWWLGRAAAAAEEKKKVLVAIFQRGAADGLNIVAPFNDKRYKELRPTIGVQSNNVIDLDGQFGLNPVLQPFKKLWDDKLLAIVEATGSPDPSRSHFDAQDYMESGTPGAKRDGWLNRALPTGSEHHSPLQAISVTPNLPRTLQGDHPAIAISDIQQFHASEETRDTIASMYANSRDRKLSDAGNNAFAAANLMELLRKSPYTASNGAQYMQGGQLGQHLQQIARLIKSDCGVEAAFAEIGGWDHHQQEQAQMNNVLRQFGSAMSAFCTDMGDRMEDIVLVTMSEFGRTAEENGNGGTDHGHGNVMFVIGGPVAGGKIYGKWPGLEKEQLFEGRDLAVTTDFRTVLSEVIAGQLGTTNGKQIFPGYQPVEPLGLLRRG